jgi:CMP-N-acetylneuraminic acid synthetase
MGEFRERGGAHPAPPYVLGVIPARGGSLGVPGKNVIPIAGRPVIHYTLAAAAEARRLDEVVVSTDCPTIRRVASGFAGGSAAIVDRPAELARADSPIQDALWHALRWVEKRSGHAVDIVVWLSANIPHRKAGMIDAVVAHHLATGADSVASVTPVKDHPVFLKRIGPDGLLVPYLDGGGVYRRQDVEPLVAVDGSVVSIRRDVLEASLGSKASHAYLGRRIGYVVQESMYNAELDEPEDVELLEVLLRGAESRR